MVVLDTSVIFKWFEESEIHRQQAKLLLEQHLLGKDEISVPDLLLYEITNAWSTKSKIPTHQILKNLQLLKKYHLHILPCGFEEAKQAIELSRKHQITVYDAIYLVLAKNNKCNLITADIKLAKQVNLPFIKPLDTLFI